MSEWLEGRRFVSWSRTRRGEKTLLLVAVVSCAVTVVALALLAFG